MDYKLYIIEGISRSDCYCDLSEELKGDVVRAKIEKYFESGYVSAEVEGINFPILNKAAYFFQIKLKPLQ
jgi:DNA-binding transcriptional ArsR family regulator